ncbi:hypothetical protein HGQ85_18735, partial [Clostridioides difficile]|nr:hypothetical protein [Clostridioides difficile]
MPNELNFNNEIEEYLITTPAHANEFNKRQNSLLENDKYLNNKIETTKTELNTRIDTENEKQNIKIDQLIAGGSNVASTQTITIGDWLDDEENGFKAIVTHNLLTQRIVVNIIDATTKENVVTNFKIIDDNSIEVRSETKTELHVYV